MYTLKAKLLGVSPLTFSIGLGKSFKEDYLKRRNGNLIQIGNICNKIQPCCNVMKINSRKRWVCLKESYIAYMNIESGYLLSFPILFDHNLQVNKGFIAGSLYGLKINNSQRSLYLKLKTKEIMTSWYKSIKSLEKNNAKGFCAKQRFESFAPERKNQICKWFVNAGQYMEHVLAAINEAQEEIFITDWWLSPEIFLKRPTDDLQYRLDKILLKKSVIKINSGNPIFTSFS